jgi:hypothetical protein
MKKSLPVAVLLATICVSAALALVQTIHNKAIPRSRNGHSPPSLPGHRAKGAE